MGARSLLIVASLAAIIVSNQLPAFESSGTARVIDGDTIEVAGVRNRLHGIDAPEKNQTCLTRDGVKWACGKEAGKALVRKIANHSVICKGKKRGIYHRIISVCYAGGVNLNAWMVRHGWAVAYRRYSHDYVALEVAAGAARLGLWSGSFVMPWKWRRDKRKAGQP